MLQLAVLAASLSSASAAHTAHSTSVAQCVRGCEAKNVCHGSLESLSCEASCQAVCKCARISRRMLNKPKHCMADALEEHQKRLSLFRMGHPRMKKIILQDDRSDSDFASYVPLEDFWPHGHPDADADESSLVNSKPVMLNSRSQLSLLRKEAMPWSPEHRSLGSRSKHHHKHRNHHSAVFLEKRKNATKVEKTAAAKDDVAAKKSVANLTAIAVNATTRTNASKAGFKANASKAGFNAPTAVKPVTSSGFTNATKPAKVVALSKSTKLNSTKVVAAVKALEPAEKK